MASSVTTREKANKKDIDHQNTKGVIQQLSDLFGSVLNLQIIESVAHSCNYDVEMSSDRLLEMTSSVDNCSVTNGNSEQEPIKNSEVINTIDAIPNSASDGFLNQNLNQSQLFPEVQSNKPQKQKDLEKVITTISQGYRILILMRGLPGSGKSYLSKFIIDATIGQGNYKDHVFTTDDYFMKNGRYIFEGSKLSEAHGWNHNRALRAMSQGVSPVIIDNTNTQMWEMRPYAMMAVDYGYYIEILEPNTPWCFNARELARRNKHNVPRPSINDMLLKYKKQVTGYDLLCAYNLRYSKNKPPLFRNKPPLTYGSNWYSCSNLTSSVHGLNNSTSKLMSTLSSSLPHINEMPIETINLMDFNEESITSPADQPIIIEDEDEDDVRIVDDILTCSPVNESGILKPYLVNTSAINDTQACKNNNKFSVEKTLQNVESAWGIDAKALHSWDIVTPIDNIPKENNEEKIIEEVEILVEAKDSSTNTASRDFNLQKSDFLPNDVKIIYGQNRDINIETQVNSEFSVAKRPKLDKSCSVDFGELDLEMAESMDHLEHLKSLFPTIPKKYLLDILQKCKGDLNWTVDVLLESKIIIEDENDDETMVPASAESPNPEAIMSYREQNLEINQNMFETRSRFIANEFIGDDMQYSHNSETRTVFKKEVGPEVSSSSTEEIRYGMKEPVASTSKGLSSASPIPLHYDSDMDSDLGSDKSDDLETMELNLGDVLMNQLEERFKHELPGYPQGFQPIVQVPVALAKQLFALYLESAYQQEESQNKILDDLVKQDEELAKKLDEQEIINTKSRKENVRSFCEIMDEPVEQNVFKAEVNQWKNLTPDTLAAKMTRQKLFNSFPTVDRNAIVEILHAHDDNYDATVETLLNSAPKLPINGSPSEIKQPPISEQVISEMKKDVIKHCTTEDGDVEQTAEQYRQEARDYLDRRKELYQKAQIYYQRGMMEVAQFYSEMATKQTNLFEQANSLAATSFVNEHAKKLQSWDTLDLHYLFAKEAITTLDIFLDRNINLLRENDEKTLQQLYIITGRGKNSENGVSKLKPIVFARLKKRKINYYQLNPGLLKIKISKNSLMTSDVP